MGALKVFAVSVARIAAIIVLVIVALSVLGFGGSALWEQWMRARETARNAPLEELKNWPPIQVEALGGVTLRLSTKWREEKLLYRFDVDGYPPKIAAAMDGSTTASIWNLEFLDKDGFQALNFEVPVSSMKRISTVVPGQFKGLSANAYTDMSADKYRRADSWSIGWRGFAEPKPPPSVEAESTNPTPPQARPVARPTPQVPKWRDTRLWRQLNRQMSKEQVRQLLGEPTKIDDNKVRVYWYWGYPAGGKVIFNEDGSIYGFEEP